MPVHPANLPADGGAGHVAIGATDADVEAGACLCLIKSGGAVEPEEVAFVKFNAGAVLVRNVLNLTCQARQLDARLDQLQAAILKSAR